MLSLPLLILYSLPSSEAQIYVYSPHCWLGINPQLCSGPRRHPWRLKQTDTRAKSGTCSVEHPFVQSGQKHGYEEGRETVEKANCPWGLPPASSCPTEKTLPAMCTGLQELLRSIADSEKSSKLIIPQRNAGGRNGVRAIYQEAIASY